MREEGGGRMRGREEEEEAGGRRRQGTYPPGCVRGGGGRGLGYPRSRRTGNQCPSAVPKKHAKNRAVQSKLQAILWLLKFRITICAASAIANTQAHACACA